MEVTILLLNNNYASTALGPIEVFYAAGQLWNTLQMIEPHPCFRVTVASIDGKSVMSPYGVGLSPQAAMRDVKHTDLIIVPASGLELDAELNRHADLLPWLREWHAKGCYIAGICSGAAYLAEAGLLDGRQATTHWALAAMYEQRYPQVTWRTDLFITEDRRVLCCGGVYGAIDLSLYLVEKFFGHELAVQCAKALLVNMPRMHQSGYAVLPVGRPHADEAMRVAEAYIMQHFASDLSIEALAKRACMSPRTFMRRFKAATGRAWGNYVQTLRITIAKELLEDGGHSVQAVSSAVGYDDIGFFRTLFKRLTGMPPGEYRAQFARKPEFHTSHAAAPLD